MNMNGIWKWRMIFHWFFPGNMSYSHEIPIRSGDLDDLILGHLKHRFTAARQHNRSEVVPICPLNGWNPDQMMAKSFATQFFENLMLPPSSPNQITMSLSFPTIFPPFSHHFPTISETETRKQLVVFVTSISTVTKVAKLGQPPNFVIIQRLKYEATRM